MRDHDKKAGSLNIPLEEDSLLRPIFYSQLAEIYGDERESESQDNESPDNELENWLISKFDHELIEADVLPEETTLQIEKHALSAFLCEKKVHFIWVGGPVPKPYWLGLLSFSHAARKQGFEVCLWVDNTQNIEKTIQGLVPDTLFATNVVSTQFRIRHINEAISRCGENDGKKGKLKKQLLEEYVNRERVGAKNLAAVSDLLRYEILYQEGGYYFDMDAATDFLYSYLNNPNTKKSDKNPEVRKFFTEDLVFAKRFQNLTQMVAKEGMLCCRYKKEPQTAQTDGHICNNSILAGKKGSKILSEILEIAITHYCLTECFFKENRSALEGSVGFATEISRRFFFFMRLTKEADFLFEKLSTQKRSLSDEDVYLFWDEWSEYFYNWGLSKEPYYSDAINFVAHLKTIVLDEEKGHFEKNAYIHNAFLFAVGMKKIKYTELARNEKTLLDLKRSKQDSDGFWWRLHVTISTSGPQILLDLLSYRFGEVPEHASFPVIFENGTLTAFRVGGIEIPYNVFIKSALSWMNQSKESFDDSHKSLKFSSDPLTQFKK